jgi:signal peptidase I
MARQRARRWGVILLMSFALFLAGNLFQPTVVVGQSMAPTLTSGRLIWVDRTYYKLHKPRRGEVVVFALNGDVYVKRIYRCPGESLHFVASHDDWLGPVREQRVDEVKQRYERIRRGLKVKEMRVPEDTVFVLGDNMPCSEDSRALGPIPMSSILGRARLEVDQTKAISYEFVPCTRPALSRHAELKAAADRKARDASKKKGVLRASAHAKRPGVNVAVGFWSGR